MFGDLDALLAPMGAARFFSEHYEKQPLHLPARGGARHAILGHEALLDALSGAGGVPDGAVLFPEHAGTTTDELVRDRGRLRAYLDDGHPLVWNRARGLWPEVDAVSTLLAEALGAHVWPNVYATGTAGTPFDVHFDAHEVIALQCEGEKAWQISEVRVDRPLDAAEMEPAIAAALRGRRDEAAARTALAFTALPGDLVYVPRGQFHNAKASGGRSLHVTFGIRLPSGFEIARQIVLDLLADPMMRDYLPPRPLDPGGAREATFLAEVSARLAAAAGPDDLGRAASALRKTWIAQRSRIRG